MRACQCSASASGSHVDTCRFRSCMRADGIEPTGYSRSIRCSHHLFVTTGTATRHSEARPRRRFHAMWLLARSEEACSPSSSPSR